MSYCKQEGKDRIIFVTKEDHATPSNAELIAEDPNDPYEEQGLILPSGDINWNCPCLGGMASGPCGTQFKEAFSCFHYSLEEVKGSECLGHFRDMQECMQSYPELYPKDEEEDAGGSAAPAGDQPDDAGAAAAPPTVDDSASTPPASDIAPVVPPPTSQPDSTTSSDTTAAPVDTSDTTAAPVDTSDTTAAPVDGQSASS